MSVERHTPPSSLPKQLAKQPAAPRGRRGEQCVLRRLPPVLSSTQHYDAKKIKKIKKISRDGTEYPKKTASTTTRTATYATPPQPPVELVPEPEPEPDPEPEPEQTLLPTHYSQPESRPHGG
jgi:hypothetical protein